MTTVMSMADFQAALQSSDPAALGSAECDGQTWNVKDAVKDVMGPGGADTRKPTAAASAPVSGSTTTDASGADVAIAVLQASVQDKHDADTNDGEVARKNDKTTHQNTSAQASSTAVTFSGPSNGMTTSVNVLAVSAASTTSPAPGISVVA